MKKIKVTKFGDYDKHVSKTEQLKETYSVGSEVVKELTYDVNEVQAQSDVHLEDDLGKGKAVIMRMFEFAVNPLQYNTEHKPTTQELFNAHAKQIELMLWGDGLVAMPEVNPTITVSKDKKNYRIFVGAQARSGVAVIDTPRTLSQLAKT